MNILYFGGHKWEEGAWFRKQQFALRLSQRGHRVFYVEDAPSMIRRKKGDKNLLLKTTHKKINNNLHIITPSAVFPYPRNFKIRHLYNLKLMNDISKIFGREKIKEFILWASRIEISTVFKNLDNIKIIDICDDLPFYMKLAGDEKGFISTTHFFELAFSGADIPIVSAEKLREKYQYLTDKEIIVVPNGHNIQIKDIEEINIPEEIKKIPSPRIGFLGSLFQFTDDNLLEYMIKNRPNYNFIFVGGIEKGFPKGKIENYNNVFFLGRKPKEEIPGYIKGFDICINPFKVHEVNDSVNPLKIFEYLALNKFVISTKMYSLQKEEISKYVIFVGDKEEFLMKLDELIEKSKYNNNVDRDVINKYNWDFLFNKMLVSIKELYELDLR